MDVVCPVCQTRWPTLAEATACAGAPHRQCPTCLRLTSLDSRYCDYDGSLLGPDPAEAEFDALQCWPVTFSDGQRGWVRSLNPPTADDLATLEHELDQILAGRTHDGSDADR